MLNNIFVASGQLVALLCHCVYPAVLQRRGRLYIDLVYEGTLDELHFRVIILHGSSGM